MTAKTKDYTGSSGSGISEAIQNAIEQAGEHTHIEIIETRSSHTAEDKRYYQATVKIY